MAEGRDHYPEKIHFSFIFNDIVNNNLTAIFIYYIFFIYYIARHNNFRTF